LPSVSHKQQLMSSSASAAGKAETVWGRSPIRRAYSCPSLHAVDVFADEAVGTVESHVLRRSLSSPISCQQDAEEEQHYDNSTCAICLGTSGDTQTVTLQCAHLFCRCCFEAFLASLMGSGRRASCPTCRQQVEQNPLCMQDGDSPGENQDQALPADIPEARSLPRSTRRALRRAHVKACPHCHSVIEKNGGCNVVTCVCGHQFRWDEVRTIVPCRKVHRQNGIPSAWGSTCPGCSPIAKMKLAGRRVGIVVASVPVIAAGTAVVVAAVATCVVTAPPVLACAALHRRIHGRA